MSSQTTASNEAQTPTIPAGVQPVLVSGRSNEDHFIVVDVSNRRWKGQASPSSVGLLGDIARYLPQKMVSSLIDQAKFMGEQNKKSLDEYHKVNGTSAEATKTE